MLAGVLRFTKEGKPNILPARVSPRVDAARYLGCDEVRTR